MQQNVLPKASERKKEGRAISWKRFNRTPSESALQSSGSGTYRTRSQRLSGPYAPDLAWRFCSCLRTQHPYPRRYLCEFGVGSGQGGVHTSNVRPAVSGMKKQKAAATKHHAPKLAI